MIVGANLYSVTKSAAERSAAVGEAATAAPEPSTPASDALAKLGNFVEEAALSRKAFAEERLKQIKEQMNTLSLFNLAPGFLADHSARMANELKSAASDFATSFKTLASLGQQSSNDGTLPPAYSDLLSDDVPSGLKLTTEDAETAASFADTALQLRYVVEMASEGFEDRFDKRRTADGARDATSQIVDMMARLQSPSAFTKIYW